MSRPTIKSCLEENEALKNSVENAEAELAASKQSVESLTAELETIKAELADTTQVVAELNTQLAAAEADQNIVIEENTDLEAEVEQLKTDGETTAEENESAERKAATIIAAVGINPVSATEDTAKKEATSDDARAEFYSITDPVERGNFYNQNRKLILNR